MNDAEYRTWEVFWQQLPRTLLDPIVTAVAAGAVLGFLGVYVISRRMVFISAALSQLSGLGVATAFLLGSVAGDAGLLTAPIVWALGMSLAATFLFRLDPSRLGLSRDSLLGMAYILASALTLLIGAHIPDHAHAIKNVLFGAAAAVSPTHFWLTVVVGGLVLALHLVLLRGMAAATFDPVGAKVQGLPVAALDVVLFVSIAVMVAITTRALGALPVFGFTVLPAMAGLAVARHLGQALAIAAVVGGLSGALGYAYSFFLGYSPGAAQAALAGVLCFGALGARLASNRSFPLPRRLAGGAVGLALPVLALLPLLLQPAAAPRHEHPASRAVTHEEAHGHADVPTLLQTLASSEDADARAHAAHELGHLQAEEGRDALVRALADAVWKVRVEAAEALGSLGGRDAPEALVRALRDDEDPWVRATVARALCHFEDERAHDALRAAAEQDPDPEVRATARQHAGCSRAE